MLQLNQDNNKEGLQVLAENFHNQVLKPFVRGREEYITRLRVERYSDEQIEKIMKPVPEFTDGKWW